MTGADQLKLRDTILEAVNAIIQAEGGPVPVKEVRLVPGAEFLDHTYGTAILLPDGGIALRVAVGRPAPAVVDTILHETAHVLLGPEHVDRPDHGEAFQRLYGRLTQKYGGSFASQLA